MQPMNSDILKEEQTPSALPHILQPYPVLPCHQIYQPKQLFRENASVTSLILSLTLLVGTIMFYCLHLGIIPSAQVLLPYECLLLVRVLLGTLSIVFGVLGLRSRLRGAAIAGLVLGIVVAIPFLLDGVIIFNCFLYFFAMG